MKIYPVIQIRSNSKIKKISKSLLVSFPKCVSRQLILFSVLLFTNGASATEIAECTGNQDYDDSPVIAKIYFENGFGHISVQTSNELFEVSTDVEFLDHDIIHIYNNRLVMDFIASPLSETTSVQSFRDGMFFVSDFTCQRELSPPSP